MTAFIIDPSPPTCGGDPGIPPQEARSGRTTFFRFFATPTLPYSPNRKGAISRRKREARLSAKSLNTPAFSQNCRIFHPGTGKRSPLRAYFRPSQKKGFLRRRGQADPTPSAGAGGEVAPVAPVPSSGFPSIPISMNPVLPTRKNRRSL